MLCCWCQQYPRQPQTIHTHHWRISLPGWEGPLPKDLKAVNTWQDQTGLLGERAHLHSSWLSRHAESNFNLIYNNSSKICWNYAGPNILRASNIHRNPHLSVEAGPAIRLPRGEHVFHTLHTEKSLPCGFGPGYVRQSVSNSCVFERFISFESSTQELFTDSRTRSLRIELSRKDTLRWELASKTTAEWCSTEERNSPHAKRLPTVWPSLFAL